MSFIAPVKIGFEGRNCECNKNEVIVYENKYDFILYCHIIPTIAGPCKNRPVKVSI